MSEEKPRKTERALRFLDAELKPPTTADWIVWVIAVPLAVLIGSQFVGTSATVAGVLLGFTLAAFGISILRSPKAFFVLLGAATIIYAILRVALK